MLIRAGYEIALDLQAPEAVILMLYLEPARDTSIRRPGQLRSDPALPIENYIDLFGNRCGRTFAPAGRITFWNDLIVEDSGLPDPQDPDAIQHEVKNLPTDTLPFLMSSRYCEVDSALNSFAWQQFGQTKPGWERVSAVCDFVHGHLKFDYLQARATRTAHEAFQEKLGVCRDFTHLAITLCRCLNIPARYATGFLGDIGVPPVDDPMDFSAWFEVYLGDRWHTFDARHNVPRIGRIVMARGRDASDCAITTTFGPHKLGSFKVWTDEVSSVGEQANEAAAACFCRASVSDAG